MEVSSLTCCRLSYFVSNPESIHFLLFLFSDRSTPADFQHADIFSVNTYRFTKKVRQRRSPRTQ